MGVTVKGKKGFQSVPKDKQRSKKQFYYLTEIELKQLKKYLKANNLSHTDFIRIYLKDVLGWDAE